MWFKNLQVYRLAAAFALTPEELAEALEPHRFAPCRPQEFARLGFVAPVGESLVHAASGYQLIALQREERLLPGEVVRREVDKKADELAQKEGRKVGRKERAALKDEVILDLLPRTFTKIRVTRAYLSPDRYLVIDAASPKQAEELLSVLREALGSLRVRPLQVNIAPADVLTRWLKGDEVFPLPADFVIGEAAALIDPAEDGGKASLTRQDLASAEVQGHLAAGKQVAKLSLCWNEALRLTLGGDLSIHRLEFADTVQEQLAYLDGAEAQAVFDGQFALMTLELSRFLPRLVEVMGGEAVSEQ